MVECLCVELVKVPQHDEYEKTERCRKIVSNNGMTTVYIGVDEKFRKIIELKHTHLRGGNHTAVCYVYGKNGVLRHIGGANAAYELEALMEALREVGFDVQYKIGKSAEWNVTAALHGIGIRLGIGPLHVYQVEK